MKALTLSAHGIPGTFRLEERPDLVPGPGQAVVSVRGSGLNHLDLWAEAGGLPVPINLPRVGGGEVSGVVSKLGEGVTHWSVGQRVVIQSNIFCGTCDFCVMGEESLCLEGALLGVSCDGGFAEEVIVPTRTLVALPDGLSFHAAAALTLAGSTAMHMLTHRTQVRAGEWVLVMGGAGGVGSSAVQIARLLGARVIATGSTQEKRDFCLKIGAHFAVDSSQPNWGKEVRQITNKRGVDLAVEHVGGPALEQVFHSLARGGRVVTCGATAGRDVSINLWPFFVKQFELIGSYGRTRHDMKMTLEWAAAGRLTAQIDRVYPLEQIPQALADLRAGRVRGKLMIDPTLS